MVPSDLPVTELVNLPGLGQVKVELGLIIQPTQGTKTGKTIFSGLEMPNSIV